METLRTPCRSCAVQSRPQSGSTGARQWSKISAVSMFLTSESVASFSYRKARRWTGLRARIPLDSRIARHPNRLRTSGQLDGAAKLSGPGALCLNEDHRLELCPRAAWSTSAWNPRMPVRSRRRTRPCTWMVPARRRPDLGPVAHPVGAGEVEYGRSHRGDGVGRSSNPFGCTIFSRIYPQFGAK